MLVGMTAKKLTTHIRVEPAGPDSWTICRYRNGAPVEGTRTRPWPWRRAVWIAGRAAEAAGLEAVCGGEPHHFPPARPGSSPLQSIPQLRALTPVEMTVAVGAALTEAEVPVVVDGQETVRTSR